MKLPDPLLQLGFATLLDADRKRHLLDALRQTVSQLSLPELDRQLAEYAPEQALAKLAGAGLRGETFFPVPLVLHAAPNLLGYYRLLYGYSQKQFYAARSGCSKFKQMEIAGKVSEAAGASIAELCTAFAGAGAILIHGLGAGLKRTAYADELCLLTLGAQYRGSANNTRGSDGIKAVFATLKAIFELETTAQDKRSIRLRNAAGKDVFVELAADPDILIRTTMEGGSDRTVVAIEVKSGEDRSNIWNRLGEAEKSHLNAKRRGVVECWTIINDPQAPETKLRTASPSTNRFYQLVDLTDDQTSGHADFKERVRDMVGL